MQPNTYLIIILVIIAAEFLISLVVSILDYRYKPTTNKASIKKDYIKAKKYLKTNIRFSVIMMFINTAILLAIILTGALNILDVAIRALGHGPISTGILFLGVIGAFFFLIEIPFSIYKTFYIEKKYGFNRTTKKIFILDLIKNAVGWAIIGLIGLFVILIFFQKAGSLAWFYCWVFLTIMQIFTMFIYPVFILPIFNNFKILKDGRLKEAIKEYLATQNVDIKLDNIRIMDSSRRTSKSSAFLTGFGGNKRLILSDTLLDGNTTEEVLAIIAHEVGHFKMHHIPKKLLLYIAETFLMMFILSFVVKNSNFFLAFGVENISVYMGLILFGVVYSPIALFFSILTNYISRKYEYAADCYAAETASPEAIASALDNLGSYNLTNPTPHPLRVFIEYTHPPIKTRINKLLG